MAIRKTNDGTTIVKGLAVVVHGVVKDYDSTAQPGAQIAVHLQTRDGNVNYHNYPIVYVDAECLKAATDLPFNPVT
jgi:hypothetical protein